MILIIIRMKNGENFMIFLGAGEALCKKSEIRCSTHEGIQDLSTEK
jgi:hypothetical protein